MQEEYRKHQHTMIIAGTGVFLFGLWSLVKTILYILFANSDEEGLDIPEYDTPEEAMFVMIFVLVFLAVVLCIDLFLRWRLGVKARAIGEGSKEPGVSFRLQAGYVTLIDAIEIVTGVMSLMQTPDNPADIVVTLLVDITSFVTIMQMLFAAYRMKKLKSEMEMSPADTAQTN